MYRYTITVPRVRNDGSDVDPRHIGAVEYSLVDTFGGFTRTDAIGAWRPDGGPTYHEPVYVYAIDADNPRWTEVVRIARLVLALLSQESVYVTITAPSGAQRRQFIEREPVVT